MPSKRWTVAGRKWAAAAAVFAALCCPAVVAACGGPGVRPADTPAPAASASFVVPTDWNQPLALCGPGGWGRVFRPRGMWVRASRREGRERFIDPEAVSFEVRPSGCWSTGTDSYVSECSAKVTGARRIQVNSRFCLGRAPGSGPK